MNELYQGHLPTEKAAKVGADLRAIREELSAFPPSDVVWDIEDRTKLPPWGDNITETITDLGNYFMTKNGRDMIPFMWDIVEEAARIGCDVSIR